MEEKLEDWQDDLDGATLSEKWRDESRRKRSASREIEEWSPRLIYNRYDWISGIEYVDIGMELQSHGIIKDHE